MQEIIITTIGTALTLVLMYLVKGLDKFMKVKIKALKDEEILKDKELAQIGLNTAEKAIQTVTEATVGKLEEIVAKELREKIANGEARREDLYILADEAYQEITNMIKPELLLELSKSIKDIDLYIRNQIEKELYLLKAKSKNIELN